MRPLPRNHVYPLRNTSPPVNQEIKISWSGAGKQNGSRYISSAGTSKYSPIPCVIGSPALRSRWPRSALSRYVGQLQRNGNRQGDGGGIGGGGLCRLFGGRRNAVAAPDHRRAGYKAKPWIDHNVALLAPYAQAGIPLRCRAQLYPHHP